MRTEQIRKKLLAWYRKEKRRLPWRGTSDPYRIWVSEVMLQQTTVEAVRRRYERFLKRFPSLVKLARAREESVLAAWSGLGYYARARNLWRAAREIERHSGGRIPADPAVLRGLPGFGEYTAAAVASLAFGARIPAADANVTRVISRLFAIGGVAGQPRHRAAVLERVEALLPALRPGDLTAALMDLGQLFCTPRRPDCPRCPLRAPCEARRLTRPEDFPQRLAKARPTRTPVAALYAHQAGRALLVRRNASLLSGLWEFPSAEATTRARARRLLAKKIRPLGFGLVSPRCAKVFHTVVKRRLEVEIYPARAVPHAARRLPTSVEARWFRPKELSRAAIPTLTRKVAQACGFLRKPKQRIL